MISDKLKRILDKLIEMYGYSDAIEKYNRVMRDKRYYREEHEESIQNCLRYMREEWNKSRDKKISSILEKRILNFKDFNYKFS